ncbi:MAG: hypothetical protein ACJ73S_10740 [Mycobacteriales bacterium]
MAQPPPAHPDRSPLLVLVLTLVTVVCAGLAVVVAVNRRDHGTGRLAGLAPAGTAPPTGLPGGLPTALASSLPSAFASISAHAGPHFTGDLRTLLVPAPPGASQWPDPPGANGNVTLDELAGQYAHPDRIRPDLVNNHFTHGAVQTWEDDTGKVEVQLIQFDTDAHAAAFLATHQAGHRDAYGAQNCGAMFSVPGSMVCFDPKPQNDGTVGGVAIFGLHAIVGVVASVQAAPGDRNLVAGIGLAQWVRLN